MAQIIFDINGESYLGGKVYNPKGNWVNDIRQSPLRNYQYDFIRVFIGRFGNDAKGRVELSLHDKNGNEVVSGSKIISATGGGVEMTVTAEATAGDNGSTETAPNWNIDFANFSTFYVKVLILGTTGRSASILEQVVSGLGYNVGQMSEVEYKGSGAYEIVFPGRVVE